MLRFALKWKKSVFFAAIAVLAFTLFLARFLKTELYSGTDEGIVQVAMTFRPNLDLEAMDGTVREVEEFVGASDDIKSFSTTVDKNGATARISAYKSDDTDLTTQNIVDDWNVKLNNFSKICEIEASAGSAMGSGQLSSTNTKEYDIQSADLDKLKATSKQIMEIMENTDGVLYTSSDYTNAGSKAMVVIDPVMAAARGFSAQQVAGLVYTNMSGSKAVDVTIDTKKYEVTVKYPDDYYKNISDVESMTFTNAMGQSVPISELGEVRFASAPQTVVRKDGLYVDQIVATMTESSRDEVVEALQEKMDGLVLDGDVSFAEDAMTKMMNEEFSALGQAIFIAIFLVFFVMAVQFESIADAVLIMMCVPFAGIGSILFLLVMNIKISMVSLMGVLMLAGIVVNNGIILIDMAIQNQHAGMETTEALIDAGTGRLRPILMTTLTTVIAMIPVAFGWSKKAMTMQGMAGVIVGGLTASTVLTLVLLPTFYLLLDRLRAKIAARQERRRVKQEQKVIAEEQKLKDKEKAGAKVNLIFPMGGAGTRFLDDGFDCPKPLIDLNGEPFFKRAADSLIGHVKYERLIFVVLKEHIEKFEIDKRIREYYPDAKIVTLPKVLPGAVMTAIEGARAVHNDLPVIFTDCDLMFTSRGMYDFYSSGELSADGSLLTFKSDLDRYSYVKIGEDGCAVETAEKKVISENAITGSYGFSSASLFLDMAERYRKNCSYDEYFMSGIYNELISTGRKVKVFGVDTYMSFGTPDEYEKAKETLKDKDDQGEKENE